MLKLTNMKGVLTMLSQETMNIIKSTAPVLAENGNTITTAFYKRMFKANPELLNIFNDANQSKGLQQGALAQTVYAAAANIDNLQAIVPVVIQIGHKHRSLGVLPEHYPIVGYHLIEAIKEVLGEAATPEIIEAWTTTYGVLADVFIDVEKNMYEEAAETKGGWHLFKPFKIVDKVEESDVITSFYLQPVDGQPLPDYKPGQYITVRLSIEGQKNILNRQYSLSQAPNDKAFRISVKREDECTPAGKVSVHLHNSLNIGDEIEVSAPAGEFTLTEDTNQAVTLISGGVGITPMMSMFDYIAKHTPNRPTAFLHSARTRKHQAFHEAIQKHQQSMPNAKYEVLYSEEGDGFINREFLQQHVLPNSDIYVCGPAPFMEKVISELQQLGFADEQIHYEFFGPKQQLATV